MTLQEKIITFDASLREYADALCAYIGIDANIDIGFHHVDPKEMPTESEIIASELGKYLRFGLHPFGKKSTYMYSKFLEETK